MADQQYPEIEALQQYLRKHRITIEKTEDAPILDWIFFVKLGIGDRSWKILVDDEYNDFDVRNPLACLFLTLNALDTYHDSDDYLVWCKELMLNVSDSILLDYYRSLAQTYREIEAIIGPIDPQIKPFDYEFRTGVVKALISHKAK